jgi:hypothetical protein
LADLPAMIRDVYDALASNVTAPEPAPDPAVPIKKSITPNYLVCLEDGKKLKMLKRHLKTAYDMSPEDYLCQAAQRTGQGHRSGSNQAQGEAGGQAQGQAPGRQEVTPSGLPTPAQGDARGPVMVSTPQSRHGSGGEFCGMSAIAGAHASGALELQFGEGFGPSPFIAWPGDPKAVVAVLVEI